MVEVSDSWTPATNPSDIVRRIPPSFSQLQKGHSVRSHFTVWFVRRWDRMGECSSMAEPGIQNVTIDLRHVTLSC